MATLPQANKAREAHSDFLQSMGAHSIGVDKVTVGGTNTFAVIAYLQKEKPGFPQSLEIEWNNQIKKVPVVTKIASTFKPESLL